MEIAFSKLSGAGNDFIVIDNRDLSIHLSSTQINKLCTRRTGIGADGLILIEPSMKHTFSMKYHNADGLLGSMCGNGGRCAAYFAYAIGIPASSAQGYTFDANNNRYDAWITGPETVRLQMLMPKDFRINLEIEDISCHAVNTGSPHAIIYTTDLEYANVTGTGRTIRHKTDIFPEGTNVNFIEITSPDSLAIRTFERGVEDETLACGTGAVAAALMSHRLGIISGTAVQVKVKSGDTLEVRFSETMDEVFLTGPAKIIYKGNISIN
ncbi:MAG: diaminopimelate epimerase [Chlorobiales bacterium]|nr:diaminopimelate epimerase [Chlorobiales bacterium]